jgi:hypothetical protein
MTLRVGSEVKADAALSLNDGRVATRAERPLRTTAAAWHGIESQRVPQVKRRPIGRLSFRYRRANTIFLAWLNLRAKGPSRQPVLELLGFLRANGFKTFIVSCGGVESMRVFAERA